MHNPVAVLLLCALTLPVTACALTQVGINSDVSELGGPCRSIGQFDGGTEDIAVDYVERRIYVSAAHRHLQDPRHGESCSIHVLSFEELREGAIPSVATPEMNDFHPHGIGLWSPPNGVKRLFVINHPGEGRSRIEVYDIGADGKLIATGLSFENEDMLYRANDVAPTGPESFYATNELDARITQPFQQFLEVLFSVNRGRLVYGDRAGMAEVSRGLGYANGVALSEDGTYVYVTEALDGRLATFRRDESGGLHEEESVDVGVGPDNISVGADGQIWIGAHNRLVDFVQHRADISRPSPSRAFSVGRGDEVSRPEF